MNLRILLVEDSLAFQRIIPRQLSGLGEVILAKTCKEAVSLAETESFDLALLDYILPDGDAKEIVFALRKRYTPKELPIIVVSSVFDKYLACEMFSIGVNHSMPKMGGEGLLRDTVLDIYNQRKVVVPTFNVHAVTVLSWQAQDRFYCYSPQFNYRVSGESEEDATSQMKAWIRANLNKQFCPIGSVKESIFYI